MDARTLKALKASIAKWQRNVAAKIPGEAKTQAQDCPLCKLFFDDHCKGCPVAAGTGMGCCGDSPYEPAMDAWYDWRNAVWEERDDEEERRLAWAEAAQAEVDFLKSLLPPEVT